ncbi:MAG: hypothetical protein IPM98_14485 [Lewinellaceae bacterium]|nr:hypothetical protein [Lewinellaceae bacterium]
MKKALLVNLALLLFAAPAVFAQKKVYISENVLKVADQLKLDYKGMVKKAASKDTKALRDILEFGRILEKWEVAEHAVTCLELIPPATDEVYAKVVEACDNKFKTTMRIWITSAQEHTQKEHLKKPLSEWAPYTWEALNNRAVNILPKDDELSKKTAQGSSQGQLQKTPDGSSTSPLDATTTPATTTPTAIDAGRTKGTSPGKGN